jgi:Domain of unknown function (DUF222)
MDGVRGGVVLGQPAESVRRARCLFGPSGEPVRPDRLAAGVVAEEAIWPDGRPLFPHAPSAATIVGERVDDPEQAWTLMRPGADLGVAIEGLEPALLGDEVLVQAAMAHTRMIAHHEAQLARMMAELADRPIYRACGNDAENPHLAARSAAAELSLAMRWTPSHADGRVVHAVSLIRRLPATLAALDAGRIDAYQARIIDDETAMLGEQPELRAQVEADALAVAEAKTGPAVRAHIKRAIIRLAPEQAEQRRSAARAARRVTKPFSEGDGMASMTLRGPVHDLAAFWTALDTAARARRDTASKDESHPDHGTTLEQLRFDVVADLGFTALSAGHLGCCATTCPGTRQRLGSRQGRPAQINVTVAATTLLGLDDQPAELDGFGPITAHAARAIAADATWRRLLTDPASGALLDYGTVIYQPPQTLRDHIIARDRTCRWPTCSWPATSSQLDHTTPHRPDGTGGPTADHNLGPLHGRHHNDKTHHGFRFSQPKPGRFIITTPAGLTYIVDPEVIGNVDRPPPETDTNPDPPIVTDQHADDHEYLNDNGLPDEPPF